MSLLLPLTPRRPVMPIEPAAARALARGSRDSPAVEIVPAAAYGRRVGVVWESLVARAAEPNVFMDPTVVSATAAAPDRAPVLLAWHGRHLMGAWGFRIGWVRSRLPVSVLIAPADRSSFSSTPLVDREQAGTVLRAMLDTIATTPGLPKIIALDSVADGGPVMAALIAALDRCGGAIRVLRRAVRPLLFSDLTPEAYAAAVLSGDRRRRLRALRRHLAERGALTVRLMREPADVAAGLLRFRAIEAAGWKGRSGTAIGLTRDLDAYFSAAVGGLGRRGLVDLWELALDGEAVAMAAVLRSGAAAFGWKMAYDERYREFAPGILLAQDFTAHYLADPATRTVDSGSYDDSGPFGNLWRERQGVADLLIDLRGRGHPSFAAITASEIAGRALRRTARGPYQATRARLSRYLSGVARR